jgi:membrane-associated protease RseP (regulator of RpoE activity)
VDVESTRVPVAVELLPPLPAVGPPAPPAPRSRWGLAALLFLATLVTTTTLGAVWHRAALGEELSWVTPADAAAAWRDRAALGAGLAFSLPLLFILLCHEMGHYLACRRYGLPATPPFFLPAPWGLGTFGAFIRIKAPIRGKRELFDVGVAGPIAGFVALLPFLFYGIAESEPTELRVAEGGTPTVVLGSNLLMRWTIQALHPGLGAQMGLDLHPFALAAWVGLLATALNLLPLGQLDGGHILYAATGRLQRRLALPLWVALALASLLWPGWMMWCAIVLFMGLHHPPVRDEAAPLGAGRRWIALLALALLLLCFMPVPVAVVPLG